MKGKFLVSFFLFVAILLTGCQPKDLIVDKYGVSMVFVDAGSFVMGTDKPISPFGENALPAHEIFLSEYYIDQYEVNNAAYQKCVEANQCEPIDFPSSEKQQAIQQELGYLEDQSPVTYVSWMQAQAYCAWRDARLPTEAEWEKAARGTDGRTFPWGEEINCSNANYGSIGQYCEGKLMPVGSYPEGISPYGVFEMIGNVSEWVSDCYIDNYDWQEAENPIAPETEGCFRVARGGNYITADIYLTTFDRDSEEPDGGPFIGFRCAMDADEK